jgi:PPM family protein phosphatase
MIRVAEHVARTDTGHQRATNEDSHLERAPVFVVADGMGGAQAGEVASQLAVTHFTDELPGQDGDRAEQRLALAVRKANAEIHALSETDARRAGMGTTLTAAYVGRGEVSFAHVGDSRAYRLRRGELERITEDHSLVEELLRQGRLTEEEAEEHPQRSIITRALGPEPEVEVDTVTVAAEDGDVYLLCSDGLTSMVGEAAIGAILRDAPDITTAAEQLVSAALDAGGRDNVTVVLFRVEEVGGVEDTRATEELRSVPEPLTPVDGPPTEPERLAAAATSAPDTSEPISSASAAESPPDTPEPVAAASVPESPPDTPEPVSRIHRRAPRMPRLRSGPQRPRSRTWRRLAVAGVVLAVLAVIATGGVLAAQSVYFIGADENGQVTVYNGLPYTLAGGVRLYTQFYVSGITVAELSPLERGRLFNNELRSQQAATRLVSQLELDRIAGQ